MRTPSVSTAAPSWPASSGSSRGTPKQSSSAPPSSTAPRPVSHRPQYGPFNSQIRGSPDTPKGSFVQSLAESFRLGKRTPCFVDEVRKPVYVGDMVRLVAAVVSRSEPSDLSGKVLNVGGPERCTRYEMARAVMAAVGGTEDLLEERRATETDFGYRRPLDLSVDTRRLEALIPEVVFTPLAAALPLLLAPVPTEPPG